MHHGKGLSAAALLTGLAAACSSEAPRPLGPAADTDAAPVVDGALADPALETAVRLALDVPRGPLTGDTLAGLTRLTFINLADNLVTDLKPLASLASPNRLVLSGNRIIGISPLLELASLRVVSLESNPLHEISTTQHIEALRARGVRVRL